jgi:hypothetical protein
MARRRGAGDGFLSAAIGTRACRGAVPRPTPDAAGAQRLAGVPAPAQRRRRDAFPTYEQLRPWLASMPCAAQASHETVARALTLLRLTRWLSLVRRRRDPKTGRILGNLYVLHDEPLTPVRGDAARRRLPGPGQPGADPCRQGRADRGHEHAQGDRRRPAAVRPHACRRGCRCCRSAWPAWLDDPSYPQEGCDHDSEEGPGSLLRNGERPSSESEAGPKPAPDGSLRNPKQDRTVRRSY